MEALLARRVPDGEVDPGARHHQLLHHEGGLGADRELSGHVCRLHEYTCPHPDGCLDTCPAHLERGEVAGVELVLDVSQHDGALQRGLQTQQCFIKVRQAIGK